MPPKLDKLLGLVEELSSYRQLVAGLETGSAGDRTVVLDAAKPYLVAALYRRFSVPLLMVTARPENARRLYEQLLAWCDCCQARLLPEPEALPYERVSVDSSLEVERLQVLAALTGMNGAPSLVVTSVPALMQKVVSPAVFRAACHKVEAGMEVDPFRLLRRWQSLGYDTESVVEVPGTISHRGGILDIYPPTSDLPARIEFLGNTVDSIRLFDPENQCSRQKVTSVDITPATEMLPFLSCRRQEVEKLLDVLDLSGLNHEVREQFQREITGLLGEELTRSRFYAPLFNRSSLLEYLPRDALLVLDEAANMERTMIDLDAEAGEMCADKVARGELPRNFPRPYFTWEELAPMLGVRRCLHLAGWDAVENERWHQLDFAPAPNYTGRLPLFLEKVKDMLGRGWRLILVSHQADRLSELLEEEDIIAPPLPEIGQVPPPGSLTLVQGLLAEGWVMGNTCLLTDAELFGFVKQRRLLKKRPVSRQRLLVDITPGDYVVHVEHGIARLAGVTTMDADSGEKEYLVLEYAAGDRLYVPVDQIDRVSRYIGTGERVPLLSRLGTQEWSRTKQMVKESVARVAQELLALYAVREVVPGFAFDPDSLWQHELEASFPYLETPDQIEVQKQVKSDMERDKPMDRLVCGDVGYGKTEVAVRAAFKAAVSGKQVAVLVPTTVLAEQHLATFSQRLAAFPVKIEVLSRFRTQPEQSIILEGLANGSVDICIGTHRLLQKDVVFKNLGLLIIDEEQRFGVAHKEHLKRMKREVDVLTLSATPIPRTLHMSLVGVRDMSVMETPPEDRLPVKTYVAEYDEPLVREAILRELERGGQVFLVHNRVQSIAFVANRLQDLVPEARVRFAHGQMPEAALARVMVDFIQGRIDVLVCTTIIESGLDMPNANTLIVNRADRFGLPQLYQLRGRVGRGANLAHAYFLYEKGRQLTAVAEKRLKTIFQATELGAGFSIAMKDLEIRGAGTLLGVKQSGHISAIGFNLYCQLLAQAVEEQKAKPAGVTEPVIPLRSLSPAVDLPLSICIPEDYVADLTTRLGLYQRLVKSENDEQVEALKQEMEDRFGEMPAEVKNLLYALKIKVVAARAGIESIATEKGDIVLRLLEGRRCDKQQLESSLAELPPSLRDGVRVGLTRLRLNLRLVGREWREVLEVVLRGVRP